ncbi:MAG TPA: hypothetical protein VI382_09760 [Candidatus Manganitrophaceae bacterium]|nr:hypothetical protein [Candidatus Manganitrophaceae bacterium]
MKRIDPPDPTFTVNAYAGYKGEETPRSFIIKGRTFSVVEIVDRWYSEERAFFRVLADDGYRYVLRYDMEKGRWELIMQEAKR